jgi:hypothetical protein
MARPLPRAFSPDQIAAIKRIALHSAIANYQWQDRGRAPDGYTAGMALAFAYCCRKYRAGDPSVIEIAQAETDNEDDALVVYSEEFANLDMPNDDAGLDVLRHLFALMLGHGMRESSGKYCEGRDQSVENVTADTAEAGLFQQSWNSHVFTDAIPTLFEQYEFALTSQDPPQCARTTFKQGVTCNSQDLTDYGSGDGAEFQHLAKCCPQFAVEAAAACLRVRCDHFGPIVRKEVELKAEADEMLYDVQKLITSWDAPTQIPTVVIRVTADRPVKIKFIHETPKNA